MRKLIGRDWEGLERQVKERVKKIAELATQDSHLANGAEDDLFEAVLSRIASGCSDPEALAREALKSKKIDFLRWK